MCLLSLFFLSLSLCSVTRAEGGRRDSLDQPLQCEDKISRA